MSSSQAWDILHYKVIRYFADFVTSGQSQASCLSLCLSLSAKLTGHGWLLA